MTELLKMWKEYSYRSTSIRHPDYFRFYPNNECTFGGFMRWLEEKEQK